LDDLEESGQHIDLVARGLLRQGRANTEQAKRTAISFNNLSGPKEVVHGGRRGRVIRYIPDPFGSLELQELGFGDSHVRLHGNFNGDEFMEVGSKRMG
jgi:hypothetical protein